jgi:hypothetical protein
LPATKIRSESNDVPGRFPHAFEQGHTRPHGAPPQVPGARRQGNHPYEGVGLGERLLEEPVLTEDHFAPDSRTGQRSQQTSQGDLATRQLGTMVQVQDLETR